MWLSTTQRTFKNSIVLASRQIHAKRRMIREPQAMHRDSRMEYPASIRNAPFILKRELKIFSLIFAFPSLFFFSYVPSRISTSSWSQASLLQWRRRIASLMSQRASAIRNTRLPAGIRNEPRYSLQRASNAHAEREMRHACVRGRAFPSDSRKLDHQIGTVAYLSFAGRADARERIGAGGGTREDASRVFPRRARSSLESLVSPARTKTRGCRPSASMLPATRRYVIVEGTRRV